MTAPVVAAGVGMTAFGRRPEVELRALAAEAAAAALDDAGMAAGDVDLVIAGNCIAGLLGGQEMIRGQVALAGTALAGTAVLNVENACATSASAVHLARMAVASGEHEVVLALGSEKLNTGDKRASIRAIASAADVDRLDDMQRDLTGSDPTRRPGGPAESFFMEVYARMARRYMEASGATVEDFGRVTVKNRRHGTHNPHAQYRSEVSLEEVLGSRPIADPVTLLMCSPVADGAAAVLVCTPERARRAGADTVRLRASALGSGGGEGGASLVREVSGRAYAAAAIEPADVDVVEVHDAASPGELIAYEDLGLCGAGEGPALLASGATALGGRVPVNPSGGLVCKGHPIGATGAAQVVELVQQLRGRAEGRQVDGARIAVAENAGGYLHPDPAACVVTVLGRD